MTELKLLALDKDDLEIISAHMQDSVFKVGDVHWSPGSGLLSIEANRFAWESSGQRRRSYERRRAALVFKRVEAVRSTGIDPSKKDEGPDGMVELILSGTATIALDVECLEVALADIGGAWETASRPRHP